VKKHTNYRKFDKNKNAGHKSRGQNQKNFGGNKGRGGSWSDDSDNGGKNTGKSTKGQNEARTRNGDKGQKGRGSDADW
jgi:hypothetical protein